MISSLPHTIVAVLAAIVVIGPATANAQVDAYQPAGTIVVDSGFRPDVNGFRFPNYGYEPCAGDDARIDDPMNVYEFARVSNSNARVMAGQLLS